MTQARDTILRAKHVLEQVLFGKDIAIVGGANVDKEKLGSRYIVAINNHHAELKVSARVIASTIKAEQVNDLSLLDFLLVERRLDKNDNSDGFVKAPVFFYPVELWKQTNHLHPCYEWINTLYRTLDTRPLTGLIAIEFIRMMPVASVLLTGFDFYAKHTPAGTFLPSEHGGHKIPLQVEYLRDLLLFDRRFSADENLTNILWGETAKWH